MLVKKMLLEAVTVCVNYADFLAEAMPHNLTQLDAWTIVTTPDDLATQKLCNRYGVHCLKTDVFYRDNDPPRLNKSRGINHGLAHLSQGGWVLHLDGDIVLPPHFRRMIENAELDPACLYGMDRVNCVGVSEWDRFLHNPELQYEWSYLVKPPRKWPLGTRVTHGDYGGYVPIGFFQLWNPKGSGINRYPIKQDSAAEHTDLLHAVQWPRRNRHLLPEAFAIHLESGPDPFGHNWQGRKSAPFRAEPERAEPPASGKSEPIRQAATFRAVPVNDYLTG